MITKNGQLCLLLTLNMFPLKVKKLDLSQSYFSYPFGFANKTHLVTVQAVDYFLKHLTNVCLFQASTLKHAVKMVRTDQIEVPDEYIIK